MDRVLTSRGLRAGRAQHRRDAESGHTLVELTVAMTVFSIFLAMFIGAVVAVSRASTEARIDAQTSSAVGIALQRIERSARYADAINQPGAVGATAYVEWRTDAVSASTGVTTCTQLRYRADDGTIALRSWPAAESPSTGEWSVVMRDVIGTATTTYPFATIAAAAGVSNYQGLTVHLRAGLDDRAGSEAMTTMYAKNSSVESPSNAVSASGQSTTPICAGSGYRP